MPISANRRVRPPFAQVGVELREDRVECGAVRIDRRFQVGAAGRNFGVVIVIEQERAVMTVGTEFQRDDRVETARSSRHPIEAQDDAADPDRGLTCRQFVGDLGRSERLAQLRDQASLQDAGRRIGP
jgi:hypothetical protein